MGGEGVEGDHEGGAEGEAEFVVEEGEGDDMLLPHKSIQHLYQHPRKLPRHIDLIPNRQRHIPHSQLERRQVLLREEEVTRFGNKATGYVVHD